MLQVLAQYGPLVGNSCYPLTILGPRETQAKRNIKKRLKSGEEIVFYHYPAAALLMVIRNYLKHQTDPLLGGINLEDPFIQQSTEQHFHGIANHFVSLAHTLKCLFYSHMTSSERRLLLEVIVALRALCFDQSYDCWDIERLNRISDCFAPVLFKHRSKVSLNEQPNLNAMYLVKFLIIHLENIFPNMQTFQHQDKSIVPLNIIRDANNNSA